MEKQNDSMRDRLLARMPQPENLEAYREETASLLARHEKALFWGMMAFKVFYAIALALLMTEVFWGQKLRTIAPHLIRLWVAAGMFYFVGAINDLGYRIYRSKVDMLKEVKQIQIQVLELQASLQKRGDV